MYPTSPEQDWAYLKDRIESLRLMSPSITRSFFCMPSFPNLDKLLLENFKTFLLLVNAEIKNPTTKCWIMIGAVNYFHYQRSGLKTLVSGSTFASSVAPLLQIDGVNEIKKDALQQFVKFLNEHQQRVFGREDDSLDWLFDHDSASEIEGKVNKQLKEEESPGVLSGLWNLRPFS